MTRPFCVLCALLAGCAGKPVAPPVVNVATVPASAAPPSGDTAPQAAASCTRGERQLLASGEGFVEDVFVSGNHLFWLSQNEHRVRWMDLSTREVSTFIADDDLLSLRTIDARDVVATTHDNDLVAIDLRKRARRTLVAGHDHVEDALVNSDVGMDDDYVYLVRRSGPARPPSNAGFFRVRRDQPATAELMAPEPSWHFLVSGQFVYFTSKAGLMRRRLVMGAPDERLAELPKGYAQPLAVIAHRLYFAERDALVSIPEAGGAPPVERVTKVDAEMRSVFAAERCVCWSGADTSVECVAHAHDAPQIVDSGRPHFHSGDARLLAATDDALYWSDSMGGRIWTVSRER